MSLGLEAKESDSRKKDSDLSLYHVYYAAVTSSHRALYLKGVPPVTGHCIGCDVWKCVCYSLPLVTSHIHRDPIKMHPFCLGLYFKN